MLPDDETTPPVPLREIAPAHSLLAGTPGAVGVEQLGAVAPGVNNQLELQVGTILSALAPLLLEVLLPGPKQFWLEACWAITWPAVGVGLTTKPFIPSE